jgi:hypothetical protein
VRHYTRRSSISIWNLLFNLIRSVDYITNHNELLQLSTTYDSAFYESALEAQR